ncbi:hypothetical protein [Jeotgalibacillus sp. JSM ZJ347]|uniref:hypothetical protein n=1 Tax=Jeotgalibacillus sp. JSM ZJ347 TaxID=3342117 RepID=UPI0035A93121
MSDYGSIKKTTQRGAKIQKILDFLDRYGYIVGHPHFPLEDIGEDYRIEKQNYEISIYATNVAVDTTSSYISDTFNRKSYDVEEFKKKVFSGAKIVLILNHLDFSILNAQKNIEILKEDNKVTFMDSNTRRHFLTFWHSQFSTFMKIKQWILFNLGLTSSDPSENEGMEGIIFESFNE